MDLMFEAMALEADEGLSLTAYTAEPGSPSHDALRLLAGWAATSIMRALSKADRSAKAAVRRRNAQDRQLTSPLTARPLGDSGP